MTAAAAPGSIAIRRALLAVADTRGLYPLARALTERGVAVVATLVPYASLYSEGLEVELATDGDLGGFELVACNPADVAAAVARVDVTMAMANAAIDVDALALIAACARRWADVAVVVDPADYPALLAELVAGAGALGPVTRLRLAARGFAAIAAHDAAVAGFLAEVPDDAGGPTGPPPRQPRLLVGPGVRAVTNLLAGPPLAATGALYASPPAPTPYARVTETRPRGVDVSPRPTVITARRIAGRPVAASVALDLDRALALIRELRAPAAVIVRDDEPVAVRDGDHPAAALHHVLGFADEAEALLGASLALDEPPPPPLAARLHGSGLAAVIAPAATDEVVAAWPVDGPALLVADGCWHDEAGWGLAPRAWRSIAGGLLVEDVDVAPLDRTFAVAVTARAPTAAEDRDLELAARVARHVRGCALVVAGDAATLAVVGGQPDLGRAVQVARARVGDRLVGRVAAVSVPIDDPREVEALAAAGLRALWQPGGSPRDQEVIAAADRLGLAMVVTGLAHVRL